MNRIIPGTNLPRVVLIGGGFGGITLAQSLAKQAVQVVMFDKNNYHTFQPLLYQVATGGLEPDSIAFPLRKLFEDQENFIFRHANVSTINTNEKWIQTDIGKVGYDYLVIATGSKTNFFGLDLDGKAMGMKSIPEALDLRSLILQSLERSNYEPDPSVKNALLKFVIVGGGPTGVETAGALAELKRFVLPSDYPELDIRQVEIHLIEASNQLLSGMSNDSGVDALKDLERLGVHVSLNTVVKDYDGHKIQTANGQEFEAATVIWAAGVKGTALPGLEAVSLANGRIPVNAYNQLPNHSDVFVIGDTAYMHEDAPYPKGHPQVAQVAIQMAKNTAHNILQLLKGAPLRAFAYHDKGSMATVGRNKAVVDLGKMHFRGALAWLMWMGLHLLFLIGFRNRLLVLTNWIWNYFTYDRGNRVIIRSYKNQAQTHDAFYTRTQNPDKVVY